jgi:hypothetical protein
MRRERQTKKKLTQGRSEAEVYEPLGKLFFLAIADDEMKTLFPVCWTKGTREKKKNEGTSFFDMIGGLFLAKWKAAKT